MAKEHKTKESNIVKRRRILRKAVTALLVSAVLIGVFGTALLVCNNVSFVGDETFAKQMDAAMERGLVWTRAHKGEIIKRRNIGLLKMLNEIKQLRPTPVFSDIVSSFMAAPGRPQCWKRLIDPNWPIDELELNEAIKNEYLDNKWTLYAMAPDKAKITPGQMQLFEPREWSGRELVHQLNALMILRETEGASRELDELIEHLANRLSNELVFDIGLVDIGKVAFILKAGFPEKIRRKWVERIVTAQLPDGGWDGRLFCFTSDSRPLFGFSAPPSNQHATVLALTALYLVRYQYPDHFGLELSP